jgi:Pyruvate/2-oxoacid:ferredoxin oxidoreductase gamma subunit
MVILGASMAITRVVTKRALIASIRENIEERFTESNLKALEVGYELGSKIESAS